MQDLITQKDFADICGVSKQTISNNIRRGNLPVVQSGRYKKLDLSDDLVLNFAEKKGVDVSTHATSTETIKKGRIPASSTRLKSLQEQKTEQEIGKIKAERTLKEIKIEEAKGLLIDKNTLGSVLFQYLEALNHEMLEFPEIVFDTVKDKVLSGASRGEIIEVQREIIGQSISAVKKQIVERLK